MVFLVFWDSIPKRCKGVHCVDLGESVPTSIYLQNLASIQPRTSLVKFARSPRTDLRGPINFRLLSSNLDRPQLDEISFQSLKFES